MLPTLFRDYEVMVVDDGSNDATPEIIDRLAAENPHVKPLHHAKNSGYGGALSTGFSSATGDYLMFMDSIASLTSTTWRAWRPMSTQYDIVAGYRIKRNDPYYRF